MDNLTHSLVGLAAAKAGLERLSPGTTVLCVLAANAPDSDILATLGGRWFYLQHHRGITHSIVGTLLLALLLPTLFYCGDWLISRWRRRQRSVRFTGLLLASIVVSFSHPLLDWTNNYGVRPFLPFSGRWFYGDLVFIVDPWIWLLLGGAVFLLTSRNLWRKLIWAFIAFGLSLLVLSPRLENAGLEHATLIRVVWFTALASLALMRWFNFAPRFGSRLAHAALIFVVIYWGALSFLHRNALKRAEVAVGQLASKQGESVLRVAAMPTLANPLRWRCLAETDRATYLYNVTSGTQDNATPEANALRYAKPENEQATLAARAATDERARVMLAFARFPVVRVEGDCMTQAIVQFADLRYTEPRSGVRGGGFAAVEIPVACPQGGAAVETSNR